MYVRMHVYTHKYEHINTKKHTLNWTRLFLRDRKQVTASCVVISCCSEILTYCPSTCTCICCCVCECVNLCMYLSVCVCDSKHVLQDQ